MVYLANSTRCQGRRTAIGLRAAQHGSGRPVQTGRESPLSRALTAILCVPVQPPDPTSPSPAPSGGFPHKFPKRTKRNEDSMSKA